MTSSPSSPHPEIEDDEPRPGFFREMEEDAISATECQMSNIKTHLLQQRLVLKEAIRRMAANVKAKQEAEAAEEGKAAAMDHTGKETSMKILLLTL